MLSNNPGPMIRCTSMAAPMTSQESLSALASSGCMAKLRSWNRSGCLQTYSSDDLPWLLECLQAAKDMASLYCNPTGLGTDLEPTIVIVVRTPGPKDQ